MSINMRIICVYIYIYIYMYVHNYMLFGWLVFIACQPLLVYIMPKSVQQLSSTIIYGTKMSSQSF